MAKTVRTTRQLLADLAKTKPDPLRPAKVTNPFSAPNIQDFSKLTPLSLQPDFSSLLLKPPRKRKPIP